MTKLIPRSRAAAQVAAALCSCLLAWVDQASAFTPSGSKTKTGGENTPLNLSPSPSSSHTSSGGASIVRTIVGLAIVIAVIWGLAWILRQVKSGRSGQTRTGTDGLSSVAALTLGSGRTLHLVRAGRDYILLGSGEHGVVPIHRYTEAQAREAGLPPEDEPGEYRRRRLLPAGSPSEPPAHHPLGTPVTPGQPRPGDPTQLSSPWTGAIERLREWTVRR